jgi:kynureninase
MGGGWGNDPPQIACTAARFYVPARSTDGWQLSNPPILAMAPLRASLAIFDEAGMDALSANP